MIDTRQLRVYNACIMESGMKKNHFMYKLSPLIIVILNLVLLLPLSAGCGVTASNTYLELLNLVPADLNTDDSHFLVTLVDHASYYQDNGITFSDSQELIYIMNTENFELWNIVYGGFITGYSIYMDRSTIRKEYLGYDITCIDAEIHFEYPPVNGVAAIGRFDPQATAEALSNQGEWPSWAVNAYTTEDYRGVTIHSWGDGLKIHLETRLLPPHIDELGRARPLAITDNYLFYAASVETAKLVIDASQNQHSSLADLPEYAAIANGLAELKTYAAMISDGKAANLCLDSLENGDTQLTETEREILINSLGIPLKKFLTFGCGVGQDENGVYTVIIIYHQSPDDALANVSLLRQRIESVRSSVINIPWSELITETDIRAEGNVLLAKLYSSAGFWANLIYAGDNLLFHEE